MKLLDIAGTESSDALLLHLSLALKIDPFQDTQDILKGICHQDSQIGKATNSTTASSLEALALELKASSASKNSNHLSGDFTKK